MSFDSYIAVFGLGADKTTVMFVTGIDRKSRNLMWENGKSAMRVSEVSARELSYGLSLNGFFSGVVKFPHGVVPRNPE